jgi:hypothetical protein
MAILRAAGGQAMGLSGAPLDTTTLLDGQLLAEPVILGAESHIAGLMSVVHRRAPQASSAPR